MNEEEIRHLQQAYAELKEEVAQKDRRIEELEGLLMSALLSIEELKSLLPAMASRKEPWQTG